MPKSKGSELKGLLTRKSSLVTELVDAQTRHKELSAQIRKIEDKLSAVKKQITALESQGPIVTEHAILRYFERGLGVDLQDVRDHLLTPDVRTAIAQGINGPIPIDHGCKAIVKGATVVSVVGGEFGK